MLNIFNDPMMFIQYNLYIIGVNIAYIDKAILAYYISQSNSIPSNM